MSSQGYRRVKWGLIGAGDFGMMYARQLTNLPNVELVSVYSRTEENARKLAEEFGVKKWYTDYEKLLAGDDVEAVAIVTPEPHHYAPTIAALKAKKHIVLEKPIAPTLKEADEMIAASKKNPDRLFMVAHILPFHTHYALAKSEIERGAVGQIVSMYARRNAPSMWGAKLQHHSSAIFDEMIHDMECMLWFTGWKVKKVYCQTKNVRGMKKPDICWAMFTFENGAIAVIEANWFLPDNTPVISAMESLMEIHGTEGVIHIDLFDQGLRVNDKNGFRLPDASWWPEKHGRTEGALGDEIRYIADAVMYGRKLPNDLCNPERARHALAVVLAAEKSGEEDRVVQLKELG